MNPVQEFALKNIYCASGQDAQYHLKLVPVTRDKKPARRAVKVYQSYKALPDDHNKYVVFLIGNIYPEFLNFLAPKKNWLRDYWKKFSEDMTARNYIAMLYDEKGICFPTDYAYYSIIDENSILVALRYDDMSELAFGFLDRFKYLRVYSNAYFATQEFGNLANKVGVQVINKTVLTNTDKQQLQLQIDDLKTKGGDAWVFVNGMFSPSLSLLIPNRSIVEVIYDQSIDEVVEIPVSSLRTFLSTKDNRQKYLAFHDHVPPYIRYFDDNDFFIIDQSTLEQGLYFYRHKPFVIRNVTDKDYSLDTIYFNNQATALTNIVGGSNNDKVLRFYIRKPGIKRFYHYSTLKLHELYKLDNDTEYNVLLNSGPSIIDFRAEYLEDSDYFDIAQGTITNITKEKSASAIGYNAIGYYFANNYQALAAGETSVEVPLAYRKPSTVFEYNEDGVYIGTHTTTGPMYTINNSQTRHLEYIYGVAPNHIRLYKSTETADTYGEEFRVLKAGFADINRFTEWEDVTDSSEVNVDADGKITFNNSDPNVRYYVHLLNSPLIYSENVSLSPGHLYFPLRYYSDFNDGLGLGYHSIDFPLSNLEIYLNGHKLTYGVDYFIDLPYVNIVNKSYLDFTKPQQNVHIRYYGLPCQPNEINKLETNGFVSSGVLTRNKMYDIRDDRVFTVYVDGKLYPRNQVLWAEEDNTVRLTHPNNGMPYSLKEPYIPLKHLTEVDTVLLYREAVEKNTRISQFFDIVFPEKPYDQDVMAISQKHYIFSPLVSYIINNLVNNSIPDKFYTPTQTYTDVDVIEFLETEPYKQLLELDPIKQIPELLKGNILEIHPHIGNDVVTLPLLKYRFLMNVLRIIGAENTIILSGRVNVTA